MTDHDRWSDSVAAWALGALPDSERDGFEEHLAECETCREEADQLRRAADALPCAVPQVAPPPEVRGRVMAIVNSEAQLLAAAGPEADRPRRAVVDISTSKRRGRALAGLVAAALAAAAVVVTVLGSGTTTVDAQVAAAGATAQLEITGDEARLVGAQLPAPPAGRVYQVWLQRGEKVVPTDALFSVTRDGRASVAVGDVDGVDKVMVTDEPAGGSDSPTGKLLLSAVPA